MTVRVRFAPSPTGFLHVGGARTALFNWLWARHCGGTFILRIEDTDLERSTDASTDQILDSMKWLGLDWDEGPFFQSRRMDLYREHLERLVAGGFVYRCFCTTERLEAMRNAAAEKGENPLYDRTCDRLPKAEVQARLDAKMPFTWRFRCPPGITDVPETLMSGAAECRFDNESLGDFTMTRAGIEGAWGVPLYNFCCAVDDADMKITHVIRGADHVTNTARQILVLKAWGFGIPTYTHLPLIMKADKKMSKRDADADKRYPVSVSARRDLGYLNDATVNFIALLGWSLDDKTELFTREELVRVFTLDKLSKANASFDEEKYLYFNGWYIRNTPVEKLVELVKPFLAQAGLAAPERGEAWLTAIIALVRERCKLLAEFPEALTYFFKAPDSFEAAGAKKLFEKDEAADALEAAAEAIESVTPFEHDPLEARLRALCEERGVGLGKMAQPLRLAVTGRTASPGLFEVLALLGREEAISRIRRAAASVRDGAVPVA